MARFVVRNLIAAVFGLSLAATGLVLLGIPAGLVRCVLRRARTEPDMEAKLKLLVALVLGPLYLGVLAWLVAHRWGPGAGVAAGLGALPLGLFTRHFVRRRVEALADARVFVRLGNRSAVKRELLASGEVLAAEIEALAGELRPRVESGR